MADPQQLSSKDFAAKIRAKFPGAYDDVDDDTLTSKVLAKYPEYQGRVAAPQTAPPQPQGRWMNAGGNTVSAPQPQAAGLGQPDSIAAAPTDNSNYFDRVLGDIRYGTDATPVGKVLKAAGAKGTYSGVAPGAADLVTSPLTGANRIMEGQNQMMRGQVLSGTANTVGGAAEMSQIPASFVAPEATEAISQAIPSAERAGAAFNEVSGAAGKVPININKPTIAAIDAKRLADSGGSLPKVVSDFLKRTASGRPMTYSEARNFYTNATSLSADESAKMTPVMRRSLANFTQQLGDSIGGAADQVGKLAQYEQAMKEYSQAKTIEDKLAAIKKAVGKTAVYGAATGIVGGPAAYGVKRLYDAFSK